MKRGLRVCITTALACGLSALYIFHDTEGIGNVWKYFLANKSLPSVIMLFTCSTLIIGSPAYAGLEIYRYFVWRAGKSDWADVEREMGWIMRLQLLGNPKRLWSMIASTHQELYYDLRQAYRRAKRRWPRKKGEMRSVLRRKWTRNEWRGAGVLFLGELLLLYISYRIPREHLSPQLSILGTLVGMLLANLLALMVWLAGDDDEGGHREEPMQPLPTSGKDMRPMLRVRRKVGQPKTRRTLA